jgi:hypothetical protein
MSGVIVFDEGLLRLMYMSCWAALFFVISFKIYSKGIFLKIISFFVLLFSAWVYVVYMGGFFFGLISYLFYVGFLYWLSERRARPNQK